MSDRSGLFHVLDPALWQRKAVAFVTRTHQHLWGKNNEDPLVFLFRRGLTHDFIRAMHLGWNKFSQKRNPVNWGMGPDRDCFLLPAGIVVPCIVEKKLQAVFILSLEGNNPSFLVPGSPDQRMVLGPPGKDEKTCQDLLIGLRLWQDSNKTARVVIDPLAEAG